MSQSRDNESLPPEVAEEWRPFHEEMQARHDVLTGPQRRRKAIAAMIGAVLGLLLLLLVVGLVGKVAIDRRQDAAMAATQAANHATQTAQASANAATALAQATATAQQHASQATQTASAAATATAIETAIEEAASAALVADEEALAADEEAFAAALAATKTAVARDCLAEGSYEVAINGEARLSPEPGTLYVTSDPLPPTSATWNLTNRGRCPWYEVQVSLIETDLRITAELSRRGHPVEKVEPGERVDLTIRLNAPSIESIQNEWALTLNDQTHLGDRAQYLKLNVNPWIIPVSPTPKP